MDFESIVLENLALRDKCAAQERLLTGLREELTAAQETAVLWRANYEIVRAFTPPPDRHYSNYQPPVYDPKKYAGYPGGPSCPNPFSGIEVVVPPETP